MHQKRLTMSNLWPIPRKGNTFIVVPSNNKTQGIPVLVAMRDILRHVQTRKELKKIMLEGKVEVNGVKILEQGYSLLLFDVLSLPTIKKQYRLVLTEFKKFAFEEVVAKDANSKIVKVIGKKILSKGVVQFNMRDGRNVLSKDKVGVGDSVIINFKDKKIEKVVPISEKSEVLVIKGKHLGHRGKVVKVSGNEVNVSLGENEFNLNKNAVMALS